MSAVSVASGGQAIAACTQADVAGAWQAYSFAYQSGFEPYWTRCTLEIKPNGVFENTSSVCVASTGYTTRVFGMVRLIGTQGCIFDGYIYQPSGRSEFTRATMNRSKDHIDGVGTFPGGVFMYSLTKP